MSLADQVTGSSRRGPLSQIVHLLAAGSALLAGLVLTAIAVMSVGSIVPRALGFDPIQGDFELVQVALAVCVALFLPWCQLQGGNITVDFFTVRLRRSRQKRLDAAGALLFTVVISLVAWRTGANAISLKAAGETTMLLGFPLWISYAAMTPGLVLTAITALYSAVAAWTESRSE
jgi:TRAP-type C4-dicarboxylate transport system permease small subunit